MEAKRVKVLLVDGRQFSLEATSYRYVYNHRELGSCYLFERTDGHSSFVRVDRLAAIIDEESLVGRVESLATIAAAETRPVKAVGNGKS